MGVATQTMACLNIFGEKLSALGYVTLGIRLKGHGTSPWDLRDRNWESWMASVGRGYQILSRLTEKVCIVGFSTGGALALNLAADRPEFVSSPEGRCSPANTLSSMVWTTSC